MTINCTLSVPLIKLSDNGQIAELYPLASLLRVVAGDYWEN